MLEQGGQPWHSVNAQYKCEFRHEAYLRSYAGIDGPTCVDQMVKLLRHEIVEFGDWLREASGGVGCEEAHLVWCLARLIAICCTGRAGGRNVF